MRYQTALYSDTHARPRILLALPGRVKPFAALFFADPDKKNATVRWRRSLREKPFYCPPTFWNKGVPEAGAALSGTLAPAGADRVCADEAACPIAVAGAVYSAKPPPMAM